MLFCLILVTFHNLLSPITFSIYQLCCSSVCLRTVKISTLFFFLCCFHCQKKYCGKVIHPVSLLLSRSWLIVFLPIESIVKVLETLLSFISHWIILCVFSSSFSHSTHAYFSFSDFAFGILFQILLALLISEELAMFYRFSFLQARIFI